MAKLCFKKVLGHYRTIDGALKKLTKLYPVGTTNVSAIGWDSFSGVIDVVIGMDVISKGDFSKKSTAGRRRDIEYTTQKRTYDRKTIDSCFGNRYNNRQKMKRMGMVLPNGKKE